MEGGERVCGGVGAASQRCSHRDRSHPSAQPRRFLSSATQNEERSINVCVEILRVFFAVFRHDHLLELVHRLLNLGDIHCLKYLGHRFCCLAGKGH